MQRFVPKSMRCKSSETAIPTLSGLTLVGEERAKRDAPNSVGAGRVKGNHINKTYLYPVFGPGVDIAVLRCGSGTSLGV